MTQTITVIRGDGIGPAQAGVGDLLDGEVGAFDESACRLQAERFDVFGWADANLGFEQSAEVPFGEVGL